MNPPLLIKIHNQNTVTRKRKQMKLEDIKVIKKELNDRGKKKDTGKAKRRETEIDEQEGGKEQTEKLDGTLAASVCSQEDYSNTRCKRLPTRPLRSSMNAHAYPYTCPSSHISVTVPLLGLLSISPGFSPLFFYLYCPFLLPVSFIP
ncbi:hypothetical protein ATANTOWER_002389 [Ataeniobius toweri]|uniref:Uncharacterized protein n=1 Tax=Ataeniobius toweri TaxID=208326 RepID=A0ABU7BFS7_9TELE|nr:hypothetical protein [Ataeniobius toweri]